MFDKEEVYECGKCIECDRKMFEKTQNYAYLKCNSDEDGSSSVFLLNLVVYWKD